MLTVPVSLPGARCPVNEGTGVHRGLTGGASPRCTQVCCHPALRPRSQSAGGGGLAGFLRALAVLERHTGFNLQVTSGLSP